MPLSWICLGIPLATGLAEPPPPPSPPEPISTSTTFAVSRTEGPIEPSVQRPEESKEKQAAPVEEKEDSFSQRNRYGFAFVIGRGPRSFDTIEWVSQPDLLPLSDLTAWRHHRDYDFDGGLNLNVRWWAGPKGDGLTREPNLPPRVYDLNVHLTWRQRWADGIATEVTILPGLYTDFHTTPPDSFRVPGFAVGTFRLTPELHLVAGAQHLQRNRSKMLPIAGLLWEPTDRWQLRLVFPEPKLSYHLDARSDAWVYVRGEYGGGRWTIEDDFGRSDRVESSDLRVALGFEWGSLTRTFWPSSPLGTGFLEVGYVFDRQLRFTNGTPETRVPEGWMINFGCTR